MDQRHFSVIHYQVLRLLSRGLNTNEIANYLGIAIKRVELYQSELDQRFGPSAMLVQSEIAREKVDEGAVGPNGIAVD